VVLDILQCLIQRDFGLTNGCVRRTYRQLRTYLLMRDPKNREEWKYKKVVVIAHSQGGLVTSLALDMLYADVADVVLQRLEMYIAPLRPRGLGCNSSCLTFSSYTFGCAANHFNNPPNTYTPKTGGETVRFPTVRHIEHYSNGKHVATSPPPPPSSIRKS